MSIILTILLISLCIFCYSFKRYDILLFLLLLSLFNNIFEFKIGVSMKLHHFIVLLSMPKMIMYYLHSDWLKKNLKYLMLEFVLVIVIGFVVVFFVTIDDPYAIYRSFTQKPLMRALIFSSRMFFEIFTIILVVNWTLTNKINLNQIVKTIAIVLMINVFVGVVDYYSGYRIKTMISPEGRIISGRFTGLSGEPRAFGRYSSFGFIFLLYFNTLKYAKLRIFALISSFFGIILSFSASTLVITVLGLAVYFFALKNVKSLAVLFVAGVFSFGILSNNSFFQNTTISKIQKVLGSSDLKYSDTMTFFDEPAIFSRFEVFDRAALNFLYDKPEYLLFGVGPGLISIKASSYLSIYAVKIYQYGINTTPATYLINVLSRSGIVGLVFLFLFFFLLIRKIENREIRYFYLTFMLMSLLVSSSLIYFFTGLVISFIIKKQTE